MDIKEIQNLIRFVAKSDVAEVNLKMKDLEIKIKNVPSQTVVAPSVVSAQPQIAVPAAPAAPAPAPAAPAQEADTGNAEEADSKYITVKSPMIGTFYRASGPDKDPFVSVGDSVTPGTVLCIVEAMKLFNEIESEVSGKIVKVLVEDSSPIEYDQPLFLIEPA